MSESNELDIPGHLALGKGNGGLPKVTVTTPWSVAEICLNGAHVTAFHKIGEDPLLFISEASAFDPKKPIRGGVPIIFPWFGPRDELPAHGFARTVEWEIRSRLVEPDGSVKVTFGMPFVKPFEVKYIVTIGETLTMELIVTNTADEDASFESCLHTYFRVGSIDTVAIHGLEGTSYMDKVRSGKFTEDDKSFGIASEVDRVFMDTTAAVEIVDPTLGRKISLVKSGSNSTVVWNPWIAKSQAMADFGDQEYLEMVCVESGNVGKHRITLRSGEKTTLKVELRSEAMG
jgi:glucose-6-phosphate 1-epimerase